MGSYPGTGSNSGFDGIVAKSSASGLIGTRFTSRYQLQHGAGFERTNGRV